MMGIDKNKLWIFLLLIACGNLFAEKDGEEYARYAQEIIRTFAIDMQREFGLVCVGQGGRLAEDVAELHIVFDAYQRATVAQACALEVKVTERFLEAINSHVKIRPYLRDYPFTVPQARVSISFCKESGNSYIDGSVAYVFQCRGYIFYRKMGMLYEFRDIGEEPYEAALQIVQNPHLNLKHDFSQKWGEKNRERNIVATAAEEDQAFLTAFKRQKPIQRLERLQAIAENNSPMPLSEGIRELITGVTDCYFDDSLQRIADLENKGFYGDYVEYWGNGHMKVKGAVKNGLADGHVHGWYEDGTDAFKAFFAEGIKQGCHIAFFPIKTSASPETDFGRILRYNENGKAHGTQQTDYPNTQILESIMRYKDGVLEGEMSLYGDRLKGLIERRKYEHGKMIDCARFSQRS